MNYNERIRLRSFRPELTLKSIYNALIPVCERVSLKAHGNIIEISLFSYEDRGVIDNALNKLLK